MKKKVLLLNWDNYPNKTTGGVYTWAKILVDNLTDFDFSVINQLSNPNTNRNYTVPKHVKQVKLIPIYGTHRSEEFFNDKESFLKKILRSKESKIKKEFLPVYQSFLRNILSDQCDTAIVSELIIKMHKLLVTYDVKKCLEHPKTWEIFLSIVNSDPIYKNMYISDTLRAYQDIQRLLQLLAIKTPKVDLIHTSAAWMIGFIGIYAKKESGCPLILTEHGVAYRDFSLYYHIIMNNNAGKTFWKSFAYNMVKTVYDNVDLITPVCDANAKWEKNLGSDASKIKVIYNGVDTDKFHPIKVKSNERPTVVSVARVVTLKDSVCLVQSIKHIKEKIPNIQCLVYGSSDELEYSMRIVNLVRKLQLEDNIKFMGNTDNVTEAFNSGEVVISSSVAEGFPYSVIEAMACGKAIVATDVGGVSEALKGVGILVRSRRPKEIADGVLKLLHDDLLRKKYEKAALKKVFEKFTIAESVEEYRKRYNELISSYEKKKQNRELIQEVVIR